MDVLDAQEHARLDEAGNRVVLSAERVLGGVDSGGVRRPSGAHAGGGGPDLCGRLDDVSRRWRRPLTGWPMCWPAGGRARVRVWGC